MNQPCGKSCEKRSAECRKTCESWKAFEAWKFEDYERRRKMGKVNHEISTLEVKRYRRGEAVMSEKMDVRTAIRIAQENVMRLERMAQETMDREEKTCAAMEWAHGCMDRARAIRVLIRIAQAFLTAGEE